MPPPSVEKEVGYYCPGMKKETCWLEPEIENKLRRYKGSKIKKKVYPD
jgi:hypothetical protein